MRKMAKKIKIWLYKTNIRDFINSDIKVIITSDKYIFVSKVQEYTFRIVYRNLVPDDLRDVYIFSVIDEIFDELDKMRESESL
jgi:hypothetical protein